MECGLPCDARLFLCARACRARVDQLDLRRKCASPAEVRCLVCRNRAGSLGGNDLEISFLLSVLARYSVAVALDLDGGFRLLSRAHTPTLRSARYVNDVATIYKNRWSFRKQGQNGDLNQPGHLQDLLARCQAERETRLSSGGGTQCWQQVSLAETCKQSSLVSPRESRSQNFRVAATSFFPCLQNQGSLTWELGLSVTDWLRLDFWGPLTSD